MASPAAATAVEGAVTAALRSVMSRVRQAAERSGRDPGRIRVVAVSKTKPVSLIRQIFDAGHRRFGENYVQEIIDKAPQVYLYIYMFVCVCMYNEFMVKNVAVLCAQLPEEVEWHFVGHLQSNKVKSLLCEFSFRISWRFR